MGIDAAETQLEEISADVGIDAAPLEGSEMPADVLLGCEKISMGVCVTDSVAESNDVFTAVGGAGDETAAPPTCEMPSVESEEQDCFDDGDQGNERVSDKRSLDGEDGVTFEDMCSRGSPFDFQGDFQSLQISYPLSEENGSVRSTVAPVATDKASDEQDRLVSPDELVKPNADLLHLKENSGTLKEGLSKIESVSKLDSDELVQPSVNLLPVEENSSSIKEGLCGTAVACMLDESFVRPDSCGGDYFSFGLDISRVNPAEITTSTEAINEVEVGSGDEIFQPNVNLPVQEKMGSSKGCDLLVQPNVNSLPVEENSSSLEEGLCDIADMCMLDESFGRPVSCPENYFLNSSSDLDISNVNLAEIPSVSEAVGNGDELVQPNSLLSAEENSGNSMEGLCAKADVWMLDESVGRPDSHVGDYVSKSSSDVDVSRLNLAEVATLSKAVNEVGLENSERKHLARSVCVSPVVFPEVIPSSSSCRRGYRDGISGRKTRAKKVAKDSEAQDLIFKGSKGRRTCSSKTPRSSAWGVFQDLPQHFEQMSQVSPNVNGGNESLKDTSCISQGSNGKTNGKRIRLKVKVGKQVVLISEVVDNIATANNRGAVSTVDGKDRDSLDCLNKKLDKEKTDSLPVNLDTSLIPKESAVVEEACLEKPSHVDSDRFLGSETSPDSEVINVMPETHLTERYAEGVEKGFAYEEIATSRKGSKKDKQTSKRRGVRKKMGEDGTSTGAVGLGNSGNMELSIPREEEPGSSNDFMPDEKVIMTCNDEEVIPGSIDPDYPYNNVLSQSKKKGQTRKNKKGSSSRKNDKAEKITSKRKVKEMVVHDQVLCESETYKQTGTNTKEPEARSKGHHAIVSAGCPQSEMITNQLKEELSPERNAWVRCDECHKWRRIAATLADNIEATNSSWSCKENMDISFADCSIPQEKSNAEINAELDISDEDDDYDAHRNYKDLGSMRPPVPQQSSFTQIDSNKYLHRRRRTQTIDEVMVCHCMPPSSGKWGCGDECLNRMLNIECVQGMCPCGDLCSNQQFQKRSYAKLQWFKCGRKGYGLQLREGVRKGGFIIEYVGEVLDVSSYEARQRDYASKGHKHFYFMTLNGSEVIDACFQGNLGRFINHSCEPNCRTEKWMVNGEICIGLFAVRDIKKGEELTFDYNYVRVFGAAAKKCVCGSSQCRGYIGGDLQSSEVIAQGDSDDEFPEPIMLNEDGTYNMDYVSSATVDGHENPGLEVLPEDGNEIGGLLKLDNFSGVEDSENRFVSAVSQFKGTSSSEETFPFPLPLHSKDITGSPSSAIQRTNSVYEKLKGISTATDVSVVNEPFNTPPPEDVSVKPKAPTIDDKGSVIQVRPQMKTSKSSSSVKKGKSGSSTLKLNQNKVKGMASKPQAVPEKPKKTIEGTSNGRYEAVQGKLSELLDGDGGISKRKDAAKGYLKLLLLTAAGGTVNGEAIQSNRDLSMILDALLKTRSKVVLLDIVNKNGLRMLHNIMKQYRRDFKKIPILRKLLKVLEYLALREVLTIEHIIVGPPCPGMESFRESILSFTEHDDKQVHQSARNFRDRWIPRHIRKHGYNIDRDNDNNTTWGLNYTSNFSSSQNPNWYDSQPRHTEASSMNDSLPTGSNTSSAENSTAEGTRIRKRKSRWDQDAVPFKSSKTEVDEDAPPGFSKCSSHSPSNQTEDKVQYLRCPFDAVIGQPQERFKPRSPVSYGVPFLILQQFGTHHAGSIDTWAVAPGMPFHPFPPLPPHPRATQNDRSEHPNSMENQKKRVFSPNWNTHYCSSDDNTVDHHKTPQDSKNSKNSKNPSPARSVGETLVENQKKRTFSPNWNTHYCSSDDNTVDHHKTPQDSKNPSPARSVNETLVENQKKRTFSPNWNTHYCSSDDNTVDHHKTPLDSKNPSPARSVDETLVENQKKRTLSPNWNTHYCSSDDNTVDHHKTPLDSKNSKNPSPARSVDETLVENHDGSTELQEDTMESSLSESQSVFKRLKVSSSSSSSCQDLGTRYFRQQKGNNVKPPPWEWKRKCWGYSGLNSRVGRSVGSTAVVNDNRNSSSSTESLVSKEVKEKDGGDYP